MSYCKGFHDINFRVGEHLGFSTLSFGSDKSHCNLIIFSTHSLKKSYLLKHNIIFFKKFVKESADCSSGIFLA